MLGDIDWGSSLSLFCGRFLHVVKCHLPRIALCACEKFRIGALVLRTYDSFQWDNCTGSLIRRTLFKNVPNAALYKSSGPIVR